MDADEETLNLIKMGAIDSTIAEKPFTMAYYGLKALDEIHHYPVNLKRGYSWDAFSPFPTFVDTGSTLVDKSNVDAYLKSREEAQAK
jgi:ribose transport system substrate-binding protein